MLRITWREARVKHFLVHDECAWRLTRSSVLRSVCTFALSSFPDFTRSTDFFVHLVRRAFPYSWCMPETGLIQRAAHAASVGSCITDSMQALIKFRVRPDLTLALMTYAIEHLEHRGTTRNFWEANGGTRDSVLAISRRPICSARYRISAVVDCFAPDLKTTDGRHAAACLCAINGRLQERRGARLI